MIEDFSMLQELSSWSSRACQISEIGGGPLIKVNILCNASPFQQSSCADSKVGVYGLHASTPPA